LATMTRYCDFPVFWPLLFFYMIFVVVFTLKAQIKHMIKYRYKPWDFGKKTKTLYGRMPKKDSKDN